MTVSFHTFTGVTRVRPSAMRDKRGREIINPDAEKDWLRQNPQAVARVHRLELPLGRGLRESLGITIRTFIFSVRVFDPRQDKGWRLASLALPADAHFYWEADVSLEDAWPRMNGSTTGQNEFVLQALDEAAYHGDGEFGAVLELLVLPDPSALDPDGPWVADFKPYRAAT